MVEKGFLEDEFDLPEKKVEKKVVSNIEDSHPAGDELLKGLLLSAGYLTSILPALLMLILLEFINIPDPIIWGQEGPYRIVSVVSQLIVGTLIIVAMYFISKPLFKAMKKNINISIFFQGLKYALLSYVSIVVLNIIDMLLFGQSITNANQQAVESILHTSPLVGCLLTMLVAPILEELIFRYYIFKGIEKRSPILAFVITSLGFAVIHLLASIGTPFFIQDLRSMPAYAAAGIILCYAYYKTKDIRVNIMGHILYNSLATLLVFFGPQVSYVEIVDVIQTKNSIEISIDTNDELSVQLEEMTIYLYDTFIPENPGEGIDSITAEHGVFDNLEKDTHYLILIKYSTFDELFNERIYSSEYIDLFTLK